MPKHRCKPVFAGLQRLFFFSRLFGSSKAGRILCAANGYPAKKKRTISTFLPRKIPSVRIGIFGPAGCCEQFLTAYKETGASPSTQTEGVAPALLWKSVQNGPFVPLKSKRQSHMGNHKADARKSRHRQFIGLFLTPVAALFERADW